MKRTMCRKSYREIVASLHPRILLGLTATLEDMDGASILPRGLIVGSPTRCVCSTRSSARARGLRRGELEEHYFGNLPPSQSRQCMRDETLVGLGLSDLVGALHTPIGRFWIEAIDTEIFFVTLDKFENAFSPSTRYEDFGLWHAIERQYLVPFDFYGVHDGADLSTLSWGRGSYAVVSSKSITSETPAKPIPAMHAGWDSDRIGHVGPGRGAPHPDRPLTD